MSILSTRDKIQQLQLSILQEYLKIKMQEAYGKNWINKVIELCEKRVKEAKEKNFKVDAKYQKIVTRKNNKGAVRIKEKSFDITLLSALLQFDFPQICVADPETDKDYKIFRNYIRNITDDKNNYVSHLTDLDDNFLVEKLETDSLYNLMEFIQYLDDLGWADGCTEQQKFIESYKTEVNKLNNSVKLHTSMAETKLSEELIRELFEQLVNKNESIKKHETENNEGSDNAGTTEEPTDIVEEYTTKKTIITILVQDQHGIPVPGYKLKLLNCHNETIAMWTSTNDSFTLLLDTGEYRIVEDSCPQGYKTGKDFLFSVSTKSINQSYVKTVEQAVNKNQDVVKPELPKEQSSETLIQEKVVPTENESTEKIKQLLLAVKKGDVNAYLDLGICYYEGKGIKQSYKEAVNYFRKAAIQGNAEARYRLALCFLHGEGVEKKEDLAYHWFSKAARQRHAKAQYELGNCNLHGIGLTKKYVNDAIYWFRLAADKGVEEARVALKIIQQQTCNINENTTNTYNKKTNSNNENSKNSIKLLGETEPENKVLQRYLHEAEQGNIDSQHNLACAYYYGKEIEQNYEKALYWFHKAAEKGHVYAQRNLGLIYDFGKGITKDKAEAVKWWRKAAEQGDASAQFNLGNAYDEGEGVTEDKAEAVKWWRKAAEQGNAGAQNNLGWAYSNGEGVTKDKVEAEKWYRKAAEQGNIRAQKNLGALYKAKKDYENAIYWYTKAAEQGDATSQFNLGLLYNNRKSATPTEAAKWFHKSAEQGNADAQLYLGFMYEKGQGVTKNVENAITWYQKAAEQGNATAQSKLGDIYREKKDYTNAIHWYNKAAQQDDDALYDLAEMYYANKDYEFALLFYEKSAKKGNEDAKNKLNELSKLNIESNYQKGKDYYYGTMGQRNYNESLHFFKLAADKGHADAQYYLGLIYYGGKGVKENPQMAIYYFKLSAAQGNKHAQDMLKRLGY